MAKRRKARMKKSHSLLYQYIKDGVDKRWIYYERLEYDYNSLYKKATASLRKARGAWSHAPSRLDAKMLMDMAKKELEKEKELLSYIFDVDLSSLSYLNLNDKKGSQEFYKYLNNAINTKLSLEKFFERNALLIKSTQGQKNLLSFYDSYFMKAWEEIDLSLLETDIKNNLLVTNGDTARAVEITMNNYLPKIVENSINKWLNADLESGIKREGKKRGLQDAYQELLKIIEKIGYDRNKNRLIQSIYKEYELDKIKDIILQDIQSNVNNTLNKSKINEDISKIVKSLNPKIRGTRGGNIYENAMSLVFEQTDKNMKKKSGYTFKYTHTGNMGNQSADHTLYYNANINNSAVQSIMQNWGQGQGKKTVREHNIDQIRKLQNRVKARANKKGFVIYISDKNYALGKNFREKYGGFSAKSQTLLNFEKAMTKFDSNFRYAVSAILQCIPGAIGAKTQEASSFWSKEIAKYIAYMLFDDFDTIGDDMIKTGGVNYIHLMNLNGVLLPLSLILKLLAEAIEKHKDETEYVTVHLEPPEHVLYDKEFPWRDDEGTTDLTLFQKAWEEQREEAQQSFNIKINFLKSIKQIILDYV